MALGLVFGLTAVGALTAASTSGRAEDTSSTPMADLSALEQRHRAEIGALTQAYDRRVVAIKADGEGALALLGANLLQDLAGLTATAAGTARARDAELLSASEAARARRLPDESEARARFGRDRAAVNSFFQDVLASLGNSDKVPTASLDAAKKTLESRRAVDLPAMDVMHKAESAALQDRVRSAVTALDQDLAGWRQRTRTSARPWTPSWTSASAA